MYDKKQLCDKITELYPEIGECGIDVDVNFSPEKNVWIVDLKKGRHELKHHLEIPDADQCVAGKQCVSLGLEIAQLKKILRANSFNGRSFLFPAPVRMPFFSFRALRPDKETGQRRGNTRPASDRPPSQAFENRRTIVTRPDRPGRSACLHLSPVLSCRQGTPAAPLRPCSTGPRSLPFSASAGRHQEFFCN
jgi:hypothetical protein